MSPVKSSKILYTTADASPQSGAFNSLLYMSKEVRKWGYESLLALPEEYRINTAPGANGRNRIYTLRLLKPRRGQSVSYYLDYVRQNIRSVYKLADIIRKEQVTLVHINEIFDIYAAVAARMARVPCVWHIRADLSSAPLIRPVLPRVMVALSSVIISVSRSVYEHMFCQQGIETEKISVIYNPGPDPNKFHPGIDGSSVLREFGLHEHVSLVVLVAKLERRKGHEIFTRAIPQVLASFPNTHFMIVGGEVQGGNHHKEYAARLKALPHELGIAEKVIFAGYRHDIPQIMAAADVIAHCSTYPDPFPGVVLQGMSVAKPVIASNLGGPKEQIEDQISGLLIEPRNPSALAEAICSLLGDERRRSSLGETAAVRVRSTFTAESFQQKLSGLYDRLVS